MEEQPKQPEQQEVGVSEVVAALQRMRSDEGARAEAQRILVQWTEQEELKVGPESRDQIAFELRRAALYSAAGYQDEAREVLTDAGYRIDQEPTLAADTELMQEFERLSKELA
jgi:hypothetical protein